MVSARVVAAAALTCLVVVGVAWLAPGADEPALDGVAELSAPGRDEQDGLAPVRPPADTDRVPADVAAHGPARPAARAVFEHAVAGRVEDWAGQPVAGARVMVDAPEGQRQGRTDETGRFHVALRSDAPVIWQVHKLGHGLAISDPEPPRVGLRVRLEPLIKVQFEVVDRRGEPADEGSVLLLDAQEPAATPHDLASYRFRAGPLPVSADGRAAAMVPTGRWVAVTSWRRDDRPELRSFTDLERLGVRSWQHLHVPAAGPVHVRLSMPTTTLVQGRVRVGDSPLDSAVVTLEPLETWTLQGRAAASIELFTDVDGRFRVRDLAPGAWQVRVVVDEAREPDWVSRLDIADGGAHELEIELAERGLEVLALRQDESGAWVPGAGERVVVERESAGTASLVDGHRPRRPAERHWRRTDDQGRARFPTLRTGSYVVSVSSRERMSLESPQVQVPEVGLLQVELRLVPTRPLVVRAFGGARDGLFVLVATADNGVERRALFIDSATLDGGVDPLHHRATVRLPAGHYDLTVVDEHGRVRALSSADVDANTPAEGQGVIDAGSSSLAALLGARHVVELTLEGAP